MMNTETLKHLTPEAFAALGAENTVYLRPIVQDGVLAFAVHTAAGQPTAPPYLTLPYPVPAASIFDLLSMRVSEYTKKVSSV